MLRTAIVCVSFVLILNAFSTDVVSSPVSPGVRVEAPVPVAQAQELPALPIRVAIPKIGLNDSVVPVGLDEDGAMDVPGAHTSDIGWYKGGTVPGETGSAVFDAHVVAAFKKLHYVKPGDDIYVATSEGTELHFRVVDTETYRVGDLPPDLLFNRADGKRLNLITCAGQSLGGGNYSHRFVAFAELVE